MTATEVTVRSHRQSFVLPPTVKGEGTFAFYRPGGKLLSLARRGEVVLITDYNGNTDKYRLMAADAGHVLATRMESE